MSVSNIPNKVKFQLWAVSGGRCEYEGCNQPLWHDLVTKARYSTAYIAHIVAVKPNGPRGHPVLSKELEVKFSNLMLLCDAHHRLIDKEDIMGHSVERLTKMKKRHEERICRQTSLGEDRRSHVLHYGANIGQLNASISWNSSYEAIAPGWYPAQAQPIEIGLSNSPFQDDAYSFWNMERDNLRMQFERKVRPRLNQDVRHLSIFALAPQPLLVELGQLVSDISPVEVYQHQREPVDTWKWAEDGRSIDYEVVRPANSTASVALNLSLSATIVNDRIATVLGDETAIWTITIDEPSNDFLKRRAQLVEFRRCLRKVLDQIKASHTTSERIHVFPAVPVAAAVEIGRVWMQKADLPLRIYDQNSKRGGFVATLDIENNRT